MRVCILNDNFYRGSGITLAIKRLLQTDTFRKVDVHLVGCARVQAQDDALEDDTLVDSAHRHTFGLMGMLGLPMELFRFVRWLRTSGCEIIHVHHRRLAVLATLVQPYTRVPVLFTGHLTFERAAWFQRFSPRRMTAVSPSVVRYLRACTRADEVTLIYNPVDYALAAPRTQTAGPPCALSIGRLDAVKRHKDLVAAWGLLVASGVKAHLHLYGEGPLRTVLAEQVESLGLGDVVLF